MKKVEIMLTFEKMFGVFEVIFNYYEETSLSLDFLYFLKKDVVFLLICFKEGFFLKIFFKILLKGTMFAFKKKMIIGYFC